ncbi:hypothetical protein VN12_26365 [Pirellula sp. SH-Sr6A]|uniref:hypothetical protein n=1 Tax=Pirellula sp. SH-Sr6A TaxID=1632865 RepID=UPI00078B88FE|nr:hypothetical protein [Pirellula sp. SH-Sr6A]AMV35644.1 hypothetical protein VN12_26365 [Pirellula sp. SH-Sr6A]
MIDREWLKSRHRMIPGMRDVSATIYRVNADGGVSDSKAVPCVRFKDASYVEQRSEMGPRTIYLYKVHLYELELEEWRVEENDVLHIVSETHRLDLWVRLDSVLNNLMGTRFVCTCTPTIQPEGLEQQ